MDNNIYMLDVGFDKNGLAKMFIKNDGIYYVDYNFNRVSDKINAGKWLGRDIYAIELVDGKAGYYRFNGNRLVRKTQDLGQIFNFNNGVSLVRERNNKNELVTKAYYVNQDFEVVSEIYKDANLFNDDGCAVVVDLDDNSYMINQNFERISPYFDEIYAPDDEGVLIGVTKTKRTNIFEYYQFDGEKFNLVSPEYKNAGYFKGDVAVVQDIVTGKYYAIDKEFNRVSAYYDEMVGIYGNPGVIIAKNNGEREFLTSETMSKINSAKRYWKMTKKLEQEGYNPMLEAFAGYFTESEVFSDKVMSDFKVVVKDYLVHNIYRMGYDDVSGSFYVKHNRDSKADKRIDPDKMYRWIEKVVKDAPNIAEELLMLDQEKLLSMPIN